MTPKEKAKELFDKHFNIIIAMVDSAWSIRDIAKECALIAVDEIINEVPELTPEETYIDEHTTVDYFINERYIFWQEVKQEIEKL